MEIKKGKRDEARRRSLGVAVGVVNWAGTAVVVCREKWRKEEEEEERKRGREEEEEEKLRQKKLEKKN